MKLFSNQLFVAKEIAIIKLTCFAWLTAKLISWKLWLPQYRLFPILPSFGSIPDLPNCVHLILYVASLLAIGSLVFFPRRWFLLLVVSLEITSCLIDQMRWQAWEYQYLLTFFLLYCFWNNKQQFLELFALLLSATYIFSGLHKFSDQFLNDVWDGLLTHAFGFSERAVASDSIHYAGLAIGVVEVAIGIGFLLFQKKRKFVVLCATMHVLILLALGPIGANFNEVVWPWNIAMPLLAFALFYNNPIALSKAIWKPIPNRAVIFLIGVLPILNFFGIWDDYLSFKLYAGGAQKVQICFEPSDRKRELIPYETANYCGDNSITISINKWALFELKVPIYPQERTYQKFKQQWDKQYPNHRNTFIIYDYPYRQNDVREIK